MDQPQPQNTLHMSENQRNYVALAQRVHAQLMAEAQNLMNQGNAKAQEAQNELRKAVEGAFKVEGVEVPTAQVRIVNDERGHPAVLVWSDPEEAAAEKSDADDASDTTEEQPVVQEKPKPTAVNGKAAPEAARRKLPLK